MKRTPLNRDPSKPLKRTPLRPMSTKRRRRKSETDGDRAKFVRQVWLCQFCGKRKAESCHEMTAGGCRDAALDKPSCWLALCESDPASGRVGCHPIIQGWPRDVSLSRQLAIKKYSDLERYDRCQVLSVKGLALTAVTEAEVDELVAKLKQQGGEAWA